MKKFFKGITGKGKDVDAAFAPDPQQGQYAQDWGVQSEQLAAAPPAYLQQQQGFMVTNGSMRRPRRPRERLDMNYADYAPFAPQPSQPSQPPPAQQPPSVTHEAPLDKQSQLEMDQQLARQLAEQEVQQALAPPFAPPPPPTPPLPEMLGPPQQQQSEQENEADYQAALDKAMQESVVQGDYDNILRDVKLWVRDLDGALGDLGEAQRAARDRRAELDRQMSSADPEDEEGWRQIMWLSERHAETEAKLQDLGWRLKPIDDAVDSLKALDDYTRSEKPPVQEARDGLDRIIAKLLEDLNNMGLAFHHPTNPFGLQPGEGSSKDLEGDGQSRDPLRELVHSLIEETKRGSQARPPAPKPSPQAQPAPPATPVVQPAPETEWASFSDPEPQLQPVELLPEPEPVPEPSVPAEAPAVPELPPLPASPPAVVPAAAKDRPTTPEPRADLPPRAAPKVSPPRSETGSDPGSLAERSAFVRRFLTSTKRTPVPRERVFRPRRSGVKPQPGDAIKRLPRVVALYHELTKPGVVADSVGWQSTKPQAAKGTSSSSSSPGPVKGTTTSTPRTQPRRPAPAASPSVLRGKPPPPQQQQQSPRQQQAKQPASGAAEAVAAAAGAPICTLTPSEQAQLAAEVVAHKPESLEGVAEFVADMRECGADEAGGAGWPADKWAALRDAADVHDALHSMAAELADWKVDAAAGTIAESHRLASFIDRATQEAGRVTYAHEPLRQRMAKQGVPWDESLLVDLRWAAQAAAAELMAHAIDEAAQQGKSKRWQAQAVLQPLGHASMGAFKVHQFCGGLNVRATALFDQLSERTIHFARMIDHHFIRDTKWA